MQSVGSDFRCTCENDPIQYVVCNDLQNVHVRT